MLSCAILGSRRAWYGTHERCGHCATWRPRSSFGPYNHMADVYSYALLVVGNDARDHPLPRPAFSCCHDSDMRKSCAPALRHPALCVCRDGQASLKPVGSKTPGGVRQCRWSCLELENIRNTSGRTGVGFPVGCRNREFSPVVGISVLRAALDPSGDEVPGCRATRRAVPFGGDCSCSHG